MKVYENRRHPDYLAELDRRLSIDGPDGLIERAVKIKNPVQGEKRTYDRCARIDFVGTAATNLFDTAGNIVDTSAGQRLQQIFARGHELHAQGIFAKLRFLLVYPYSGYAISRIQAESTENRATMGSKRYSRDLNLVDEIDEVVFNQSSIVTIQSLMLRQLQRWIDKYGWDARGLNKIAVRFVPVSPNLCMLTINDVVFTDSYLLAKEHLFSRHCANRAPLVRIRQSDSPDAFSAYEDHFRYLWDLDITLFCEDATFYEPGRTGTLGKLRPVRQVSFVQKASIIAEKSPTLTDSELDRWRFRAMQMLQRFTMEPAPTPGSESAFITCSWQKDGDGTFVPNSRAQLLSEMLSEDFGQGPSSSQLPVRILKAPAGTYLTEQLYNNLNQSTLGIVVLTPDLESKDGRKFSKPNIYHELGYLMRQLGIDRVLIIRDKEVEVPSNIQDAMRIDVDGDKLVISYRKILRWLSRVSLLSKSAILEAFRRHQRRLEALVVEGQLEAGESAVARKRIDLDIGGFSQ